MANGQIKYLIDFDVNQQKLKALKAQLQDIQRITRTDIMRTTGLDQSKAAATLNKIKQDAVNVEIALQKAFNPKLNTVSIDVFNKKLAQLTHGGTLSDIKRSFQQAGISGQKAFTNLANQVLGVNIKLQQSNGILDKMATTLGNSIKWNIASSAINGVSRGIQQAWGFTKSLDSSLNDIRIVTGKSADEMARFSVQANQVAQNLGKNTTDYTNAALIYAQQGLSDKQIEARTAITLKTANVTGQDTKDVSKELTAVWNGYKVNAEQAQLYVDRLAAVATTTASNLKELSTAMSKVASAANAMGVSEEQLAAQLSTIISATRQAPQSVGTALRTVYARISDIKAGIDQDGVTLGNYSGKMAALGISVLDVNGRLRDMGEVMEQIGEKWQNMTREQQVNLAQTMAGQRQYNNLLALFDNFDKYSESLQVAANAQGTLSKQQDIYMDRTTAKLNQLKAATEGIYMSLTDTDSINSIIQALTTLANVTKNFVDAIGGGAGVLLNLGTIGVNVFNKQLTNGINHFIERQNESKLAAIEMQTRIKEARKMAAEETNPLKQESYERQALALQQFSTKGISAKDAETVLKYESQVRRLIDSSKQLEEQYVKLAQFSKNYGDKLNTQDGTIDNYKDSVDQLAESLKQVNEQLKKFDTVGKKEATLESLKPIRGTRGKARKKVKLENKEIQKKNKLAIQENLQKNIEEARDYLVGINEDGLTTEAIFNLAVKIQDLDKIKTEQQYKKWRAEVDKILKQQAKKNKTASEVIVNPKIKNDTNFVDNAKEQSQRISNISKTFAEKSNEIINTIFDQRRIEKMGQVVKGISAISMGITNLTNVVSIFSDKSLTPMQKFGQSITAIGMGLPMVISGISTLAEVTALAFPYIAAITVAIGTIVALAKYQSQQIKIKKEEIKTEIDDINKKQQQIEKNRQLIKSLQQLNTEIKQSNLTRTQAKERIEQLISQYNLQDQQIQKLIHSYKELGNVVEEIRQEQAQKGFDSAIQEKNKATNLVNLNFQNDRTGSQTHDQNGYDLLAKNIWYGSADNKVQQILTSLGGSRTITKGTGGLHDLENTEMQFHFDTIEQLLNFYDSLNEQINKLDSEKDKHTKDKLIKIRDSISEGMEQFKKANEDYQKYGTEVQAFADNVKAGSVKSLAEYVKANKELVSNIQSELGIQNQQRAQQLATKEFRTNYKDQWSKYDSQLAYIQELQKNLVGETNKDIQKIAHLIGNLQPNALEVLFQVHPQTFTNVEVLTQYLEEISGMKFDNVESLLGADLSTLLEIAQEDYVGYEQILEKIEKGKALSKKEYQGIAPSLQDYFKPGINGTYEIYGNLKAAREQAERLQLAGLNKALQAVSQQNAFANSSDFSEQDGSRQYKGRSFNTLANAGLYETDEGGVLHTEVNQTQAQASIEYLKNFSFDAGITANVKAFEEQIKEVGTITPQIAQAIQQEVLKTQEVFNMTNKDYKQQVKAIEDMFNQLQIGAEKLDPQALANYTQHLQNIADEVPELADNLEHNDAAAKIVAKSIMNMNKGYQQLNKNWDDWSDILKNSSKTSYEYAEAMASTRDAVADLLDISKDYISEDFIANHLKEIEEAASGSETAIDNLRAAATEDVVMKIVAENDLSEFSSSIMNAVNELQASIPDLKVGAELQNDAFYNALNQLVAQTGMTTAQVNALLDTMGFEPHFVTEYQKVDTLKPVDKTVIQSAGTYDVEVPSLLDETGQSVRTVHIPLLKQYTTQEDTTTSSEMVPIPAFANGRAPKIDKLTKKAGGSFNNGSSSNKGGGSGKKGGGGGGGGGKTYKPKDKKDLDKSKDHRYHDINQELQKSNELLTSLGKKQSRLSGQAFIDNLNQQISLLEEQIELTEQKIQLQQQDLSERKEELTKLGVIFDGENIANYQAVINAKQTEYNALLAEQNALIEQANAAQSDSFDAEIQAKDKQAQNAKKQLDDYKKQMDQYEALQKQMRELQRQIEEQLRQQQIEKQIQKFRYSIEIHLDMRKAEREWNQFKRKHLDKTTVDLLFHSDFDDILDDFQINIDNFDSFITQNDQISDHLQKTYAEIEKIQEDGWSDVYGDNLARAYEDLQKDLQSLKEGIIGIDEIISQAVDNYLNAMDQVKEKSDQHAGQLEFIGELIEHDMELLEILYGEKNYKAMANYYDKLLNNQLKQVDYHKQIANYWKTEYQNAVDEGNEKAAAAFLKNWQDEIKEFNASVTASAKTIKDQYNNAVDEVFDNLQKKLTKGKGFDYLDLEWDLLNKEDETFLDTVNSAFGLQDLEYTFNIAINDTADLKNQKALAKLRDQELKFLKDKDKLTQYDLDRAKKRLEIEQARIALEEAQQAKSTMRLRRDSQGNYRYEYVADQNQIAEAQQNYAKTQNDLYNLDKEYYNETTSNILSTTQEMNKALAEAAKIQDPQERKRQEELITQKYNERLKGLAQQLANTEKNLMSSAFQSIGTDLQTLSDTQADIMMNQMVPTWDNSVKQMTDVMLGEEGLMPLCQQAFVELDEITNQYALNLDALQETAEIDLGSIKDGASDIADEFEEKVIPDNDTVIDQIISMGEEAKTSYQEIVAMADAFNPSIAKAKELYGWLRDCVVEYQKMSADVDLDSDVTPRTRTNYVNDASGVKATDEVDVYHSSANSTSGSSSSNLASPPSSPPNSSETKSSIWKYTFNDEAKSMNIYQDYRDGQFRKLVNNDKCYWITRKDYEELISDPVAFYDTEGNVFWKYKIGNEFYYSSSNNLRSLIKRSRASSYDTGGYTGEWGDQSGKLAMLHEKELVLNKSDTSNILNSVSILRDILHNVGSNIFEKLSNLTSNKNISNLKTSEKQLEQNVHIEANFPNVNSKRQIEEAFNDLVNLAAQRAMRRK